jgi:peptide/nickel transport system substrate-binding protein
VHVLGKKWRWLAVLTVLAVLVASCGGDDDEATDGSGSEEDVDESGVLRWGLNLTSNGGLFIDPATAKTGQGTYLYPVFSSLLRRNDAGELEPELAEEATIVDPRTIKVTLREGLVFSDGEPLDAAAMKQNIERNKASNNANGLQVAELAQLSSVTVNSPTEFTITLTNPIAGLFYSMLATIDTMAQSPKAIAAGGDLSRKPVGAGPFMVQSYAEGSKITLVKNPKYWDADNVKLAGVEIIHVADAAGYQNAMRSGLLDYAPTGTVLSDQLASLPANWQADRAPGIGPLYLSICMTEKPLDDVRVRKALNFATDREAINEVLYGGDSVPAWGLWPEGHVWYNEDLEGIYDHDVAQAKKLLADAGLPNGFEVTMFTTQGGDTARLMEILQQQWAQAGITLKLEVSTNPVVDWFQNHRRSGNPYPNRRGGVDKVSRNYTSTAFANVCKFPAPKVDQLVTQISSLAETDPQVPELHKQVSEAVVDEYVFGVHTVFEVETHVWDSDRVGGIGYHRDQLSGRVPDYKSIYIKA